MFSTSAARGIEDDRSSRGYTPLSNVGTLAASGSWFTTTSSPRVYLLGLVRNVLSPVEEFETAGDAAFAHFFEGATLEQRKQEERPFFRRQ